MLPLVPRPAGGRLWRLREGYRPSAVLLLAPDEARLRHARRLLAAAPVWRTPSGSAVLDLQTTLEHTGPRAAWPVEDPPLRAALPAGVDLIVAGQAAVDGLAEQRDQVVADVAAGTAFLEIVGGYGGKVQGVIQFSECQQSGVGGDGGTM